MRTDWSGLAPRMTARLLPLAALLPLACCGPTPNEYLASSEHEYGVSRTWYGSDLRIYHAALLTPNGIGLREPGFLVGVENLHPESSGFVPDVGTERRAGERHVLTHIVRYNLDSPGDPAAGGSRSCVLFSLLDRNDTDPIRRTFQHCPGTPAYNPPPGANASRSQGVAIDRFRNALTEALRAAPANAPFTHIVVLVMGWNTDQPTALENFDTIVGNLADVARAHGQPFRPLVIGVSWPSQWTLGEWSVVPDAVVRGLSFPFKRRDANDTGAHVLRDLVLEGVLKAREKAARPMAENAPEVVMIGHSFGARALARALATDRAKRAGFADTDRLLLLQGAFEFKDLYQDHGQGPIAPAFGEAKPRLTMTASRYDSAVAAAFWGQYAGDIDTYDKVCRNVAGRFWGAGQIPKDLAPIGCGVIGSPDGVLFGQALCTATPDLDTHVVRVLDGRPVRYFDASRLVNCAQPFTGGGAHSDIFRRETAEFLWGEMQ